MSTVPRKPVCLLPLLPLGHPLPLQILPGREQWWGLSLTCSHSRQRAEDTTDPLAALMAFASLRSPALLAWLPPSWPWPWEASPSVPWHLLEPPWEPASPCFEGLLLFLCYSYRRRSHLWELMLSSVLKLEICHFLNFYEVILILCHDRAPPVEATI